MSVTGRDWRTIGVDAPRERAPLPPWIGWAIPPLVAPLAAMGWIAAHWDRIPARYASHFDLDGRADGWTLRTPLHVYGVLIFAEGLAVLLFAMMLLTWYGSKPRGRTPMHKIFLAVQYIMGVVFAFAGLTPAVHLPMWPILVLLPVASLALIVYVVRQQSEPDDYHDDTPNECWSLGGIYYNPSDTALFVRARSGTGFTLNMAHRFAWVVLGGTIGGIALLVAFLLWAER